MIKGFLSKVIYNKVGKEDKSSDFSKFFVEHLLVKKRRFFWMWPKERVKNSVKL